MRYWVYPSPVSEVKECLIVAEGRLLGDLPGHIHARFRHAEIWKTIEFDPKEKYVGLDTTEALTAIEANEYYIACVSLAMITEWPGVPGAG